MDEPAGGAAAQPPRPLRYDAFVSYSHAGSSALAPALQRGLRLVGKRWYRMPDLAVYRDQTNLSATPALWPTIERALADSRWFVLLASPQAAASPWVGKEVAWWLANRSADHVLVALTGGELVWEAAAGGFDPERTTALPDALLTAFADEPKWADLRWADNPDRTTLRHPRFRDCVAELAAPLRGLSKQELVDEDVRQQRRVTRWRNAAIAGLTALAVAVGVLAVVAVQQRDTARRERDVAVSRRLATQSAATRATQPDLAALLALEAVRQEPTDEAWQAVQAALSQPAHASWRLAGHTDAVSAVATSPDGRLAATSGGAGEVFVWRLSDGARVAGPLKHADSVVYAVAFSPDGRLVATGGSDGTARLWRVADGSAVVVPLEADGPVNAVAFSPDGTRLATGDNGGYLRVWDVATGRGAEPVLADEAGVTAVAWLSSRDEILTAGFGGQVRRWAGGSSRSTGEAIAAGSADTFGVRSIGVDAAGRLLATVAADGVARLWDLPSGRPHEPDRVEADGARAVAVSEDGSRVATVSSSVAQLWDVDTGREIGPPFLGSTDYLLDVAFSPGGDRLVAGGGDRAPRIWDVPTTQPVGRAFDVSDVVHDVALSPDGTAFAAGASGTATVHDARSGERIGGPFRAADGATTVAWSPDGRVLAVGDMDGVTRLWTTAGAAGGPDLTGDSPVYDVAFAPDGSTVLTSGFAGEVQVWALDTGRLLRELAQPPRDDDPTSSLSSLTLSPDGETVAAADLGGPVHLWSASTGQLVGSLDRGDEASTAAAFSTDGRLLAQGTSDGAVRIWDVAAGAVTCTLDGHGSWVESASFWPGSRLLATGGQDNVTRLWDVAGCRAAAAPVAGFGEAVSSLAVSPDGQTLFMASIDGTVRTAIPPDAWPAAACQLARRNMTAAEWAQHLDGPYRATCPLQPSDRTVQWSDSAVPAFRTDGHVSRSVGGTDDVTDAPRRRR